MNFVKFNIKLLGFFSLLIFACNSSNNKNDQDECCENSFNITYLTDTLTQHKHTKVDSLILQMADSSMKMVYIPNGEYIMGASKLEMALKRELPRHKVKINSFYMDVHEITNAQFAAFVSKTGYKTIAEREIDWNIFKKQLPINTPKPNSNMLQPGSMVFSLREDIFNVIDVSQWWKWTVGANWMHPFGPESSILGREDEPVVHICYHDAAAYAKWCDKRLPTEAEWEWAARGGLQNKVYPWGNQSVEDGKLKCNYWTGIFPTINTKEDSFLGKAPVMQYEANGYGLYDMSGNVWEICSDWYDGEYYSFSKKNKIINNPGGPDKWNYPLEPNDPKRVIRGGSFLCNDSYCSSYRVSARMHTSQNTGMSHIGFRCVKDVSL